MNVRWAGGLTKLWRSRPRRVGRELNEDEDRRSSYSSSSNRDSGPKPSTVGAEATRRVPRSFERQHSEEGEEKRKENLLWHRGSRVNKIIELMDTIERTNFELQERKERGRGTGGGKGGGEGEEKGGDGPSSAEQKLATHCCGCSIERNSWASMREESRGDERWEERVKELDDVVVVSRRARRNPKTSNFSKVKLKSSIIFWSDLLLDCSQGRKKVFSQRDLVRWQRCSLLFPTMQIIVKLLSGKKAQIDIESTDTIKRIKERVEEKVQSQPHPRLPSLPLFGLSPSKKHVFTTRKQPFSGLLSSPASSKPTHPSPPLRSAPAPSLSHFFPFPSFSEFKLFISSIFETGWADDSFLSVFPFPSASSLSPLFPCSFSSSRFPSPLFKAGLIYSLILLMLAC